MVTGGRANRADEIGSDMGGEAQVGPRRRSFAQAKGGACKSARPEGALMQAFDGFRVGRVFAGNDERQTGHGVSIGWGGPRAFIRLRARPLEHDPQKWELFLRWG